MRIFTYLTTILVAVFLAACGGGGGSPGLSSGSVSVFSVVAPSTVTLQAGSSQQYAILGGVKPYSVVSTDPAVAIGWIGGDNFVNVGALLPGKAALTVLDAKGSKFDIAVTSGSGLITALFTTTPALLTLAPGAQATYTVGGGTGPYTATSANSAAVSASLSGTSLTLGGLLASPTPVSVVIRDAAGATVTVSVTVGASQTLTSTAPAGLTLAPGGASAQTFTVMGGVAPYTATSNNVGVATVTLTGSTFTITGVRAGAATITILDAAGSTPLTISVTVGGLATLSTSAPAAVTIAPGAAGAQTYTVSGGVAPFAATSSNVGVATVTMTGSSFTVTGVQLGAATIRIQDAAGTTVTIAVTVGASVPLSISAPAAVTIAPGAAAAQSYSVSGGVAPYTATSNNVSVATVALTGSSFTVTGVRVGAATITILDAAGATVSTSVTVATQPLSVSPSSVTAFINDTLLVRISGGTPPYRVDAGVTDALSATIANQNEVTIRLLRAMTGYSFIVLDANNQTATVSITASAGTNVFRLSPASVTIAENETQTVLLTLFGQSSTGIPRVFSSNIGLLSATLSGNVVTLTPSGHCVLADTVVTISAVDSIGAIGTATVTVKDSQVQTPACVPL